MQVAPLQKAFYFSQPAQQRGQGFVLVAALLSKSSDLVAETLALRASSRSTGGCASSGAIRVDTPGWQVPTPNP
jgi:hypothetical protein